MSSYIEYPTRLFHDGELLEEVDFRSLPRKGEEVWFERHGDDDESLGYFMATVKSVIHVAETEEDFAYVEIYLKKLREVCKDGSDKEEETDPSHGHEYQQSAGRCANCGFYLNSNVHKKRCTVPVIC